MTGPGVTGPGVPAPGVAADPRGEAPSLGVPSIGMLASAELAKLGSRVSFRVAVGVLIAMGALMPIGMLLVQIAIRQATAEAGTQAPDIELTMSNSVDMVLRMRNFFVVRALIIWVVAEAVAGEWVARTLREDLLRPVHRSAVLAAKWIALQGFVALAALVPLALSMLLGVLFFGVSGELLPAVQRFALSWLGDAGFATMVVMIAMLLRSVPGTVVGVFLYWVLDQTLGWVLWGLETGRGLIENLVERYAVQGALSALDAVIAARPWLPSAAFNVYWDFVPGEELQWQSFAALVLYTVLSYAIADRFFNRMDVD